MLSHRNLALFILTASFAGAAMARADYVTPLPVAPDPAYESPEVQTLLYTGTPVEIRTLELITPAAAPKTSLPPGGGTFQVNSFFDIFTEISLDSGASWQPQQAQGSATIQESGGPISGGQQTFQTEMLQLNISGGTLPGGLMIRESPTLQSAGETTITDTGGGTFHIDSFFDVFTELSLDGGQTWLPANQSVHESASPEPATAALLGVAGLTLLMRRRRKS